MHWVPLVRLLLLRCVKNARCVLPLLLMLLLHPLQGDPDVQSAKALRAAFEANDVAGVEKVH